MIRPAAMLPALLAACLGAAAAEPVTVDARPIATFRIGSEQTRFGTLRFVGGVELVSGARDFGSLSGFDFVDGREDFVAVSDRGRWITGKVTRKNGVPVGLADVRIAPMVDASGRVLRDKAEADAEGLRVSDGSVWVSFEREARVEKFSLPIGDDNRPVDAGLVIPRAELRRNKGIETVAVAPGDGPLGGALVTVAERSINPDGDIFAAVSGGPRAGVFFVRRHPPFDVTDGAFLPDGDLLLLERRFNRTDGIGMRLRRIGAEAIRPGATVDGEVLLEADFGYQIDNMEGMAVSRDAAGRVFLTLVSDDNGSFFQRTLLLEFELVGDASAAAQAGSTAGPPRSRAPASSR